MSFPKYPAYKDSGIKWVGEIPVGWNIVPLKRIFSLKNGATPKSDQSDFWDGEITWITPADLNSERPEIITHSKRTISVKGAESCAVSIVPKDSIIISTRAPIGSIGLSGIDLCTNQGCRSLVPDEGVSSRFFLYFLYSAVSELQVLGKGTTFLELSSDSLASFPSCFPSLPEQQAIASFLDRECRKIDALIAEQERLIALLAEKRQAVISHAVTKGLNPNAPMKESGIEWIRKIPVGWDAKPLKRFCTVSRGASPRPIDDEKFFDDEGEFSWIRISDVTTSQGSLKKTEQKLSQLGSSLSVKIYPGDLFLSIAGSVGKVCISEIKACIHDGFVYFKNLKLNEKFVFWIFEAGLCFGGLGKMGTQLNLNTDTVGNIFIPLPQFSEQQAIANFLDQKCSKIAALIAAQERLIALCKERRAALISAAVTGKIDVRAQSKAIAA